MSQILPLFGWCSYEVRCNRGLSNRDLVWRPLGWSTLVVVLGFLAGFILWLTVKVRRTGVFVLSLCMFSLLCCTRETMLVCNNGPECS